MCAHTWDFHPKSLDDIDFFVVHHLRSKHQLHPNEILARDPSLKRALTEYCRGGF